MRLRISWTILALLLMTGAASAAECGAGTGKPATGKPISVGAIVTASGAADISTGSNGAKAYFDCVNANGGINGRPIEYVVKDDQTRPDRAAELARKLVEDDKVVAMIGSSSLVDCIATAQFYHESRIISIMAAAVAPHCYGATNISMMNSGPRYGGLVIAKHAVEQLGAKHLVCPQPTVPGADWICDGIEQFSKQKGIKFSRFPVDQQTVDNDSLVQQVLATGGDAVLYNGSVPTYVPFLGAAERADAGTNVKYLFPLPMFDPKIPQTVGPYWNNRVWVALEFKPATTSGPDGKNYLAVMSAAGLTPDGLSQGGYLAAKMFVAALMPLKPEEISRDTVTAAIQKVQTFKSDMLCENWAYGPADAKGRIGNRSGLIAEIKDGAWSVPDKCVTLTDAEIGK